MNILVGMFVLLFAMILSAFVFTISMDTKYETRFQIIGNSIVVCLMFVALSFC